MVLPGLWAIPPVDRDECRFAQASRQMFESVALPDAERDPALHAGGLAVPYYGKDPRINKPPLIYWLQATSAAVLTGGEPGRDAMWMYRVPSVLAAVLSVLCTWRIGLGMMDARAAWLGAALLAVCPLVAWESHQARADMVLLLCCTVMQLALWRVWRASLGGPAKVARRTACLMPVVFWAALSAGVMTKGPIAPLLAVSTAIALCVWTGRWAWLKRLRPLVGLGILTASVTPWVVLLAQQVGLSAYLGVLNKEVVQRATVGSSEGHFGPPGMHTALVWALFFPGCIGLLGGVARAWGRVSRRRDAGGARRFSGDPRALFLLCWLAPTWVVFEIITSKLVHYTLPMYPAVALLSGRAIAGGLIGVGTLAGATRRTRSAALRPSLWKWQQRALGAWALAGVVIGAGVAGLIPFLAPWSALGAWLAALGAGAGAWMWWRGGRAGLGTVHGWALVVGGWALIVAGALQGVAPSVAPGVESARILRAARELDPAGTLPVATMHQEDSMMFWTRGRAQRVGPQRLREALAQAPLVVVMPRQEYEELFPPGLDEPEHRVVMRPLLKSARAPWVVALVRTARPTGGRSIIGHGGGGDQPGSEQ